MDKQFLSKILVVLVVVLGLATGLTAAWGRFMAQPGPLASVASVVIAQGLGPKGIAAELQKAGVIEAPWAFVAGVRAMGLAGTLKAGEYVFEPHISLRTTINKIATGDTVGRSVTIPEGWTVREVLARLKATAGLAGEMVVPAEGMVFPDTYSFEMGMKPQKLLDQMNARMEKELNLAWEARDVNVPLKDAQELLILASIVQKEAANEAEMPKIAAVFMNRLRKGMKLQSDPTVIYGADFDGNIRRKDLSEPHPFNTYVFAGLPPTPIACPGKAALMAAARPDNATTALFFVADPSRTMHIFSDTYAEHQKNVKNYWRAVEQQEKK